MEGTAAGDERTVPFLSAAGAGRSVRSKAAAYAERAENTLNQRIYRNRDSLIHWIDGRLVHFQHAIDVTESHRLRLDADTDELTLIPNRRAGLRTLDELLEQVGQGQLSITAAMLDIDQLKAVNDQFGHREGDVLIRQISQTLTRLLRQEDLFFRLSGDEFILVLINQPVSAGTAPAQPGADAASAMG